jgi:hypothetical protein
MIPVRGAVVKPKLRAGMTAPWSVLRPHVPEVVGFLVSRLSEMPRGQVSEVAIFSEWGS